MNSKLIIIISMFFSFNFSISTRLNEPIKNYDLVPNEETAIKIAEAIWLPIYGKSVLEMKSYSAKLINGKIWYVEGNMNIEDVGGVPIIEIQKSDCKILKVTHTK